MQKALYTAVHSDPTLAGVPVDYFTGYGAGGVGAGPDPAKVAGLADYDTQHPYVLEGQAPAWWVSRTTALRNTTAAIAPAVYTETGYSSNSTQNNGVSQLVQAKYTLDLLLDAAGQGISKTYLYDLMDAYAPGSAQGDDGFGLFDYTGAPKLVATAIHNLTGLLQDSGAAAASFPVTAFDATIAGLSSTGNSMAFEKSNGTTMLAIWDEPQIWNNQTHTEVVAATHIVTVKLAQAYASIEVFDPLVGANPIATFANMDTVSIAVTDHPILIEFDPATSGAHAALLAPATDALSLTVSEDAYQGDAQFTVSVDGRQIGGVQTATASHNAGKSQTVSLSGSFGPGGHIVTVNFLNDAWGGSAATDRNLYVNAITYDGVSTVENSALLNQGPVNYYVLGSAPSIARVVPPEVAITSQLLAKDTGASASDGVTSNGAVTLTGTVSGASGTTVTLYDGIVALGPALVRRDGTWTFGTTLAQGVHALTAVAADPSGLATQSAAAATLTVQTAPPTVAITAQVLARDTGASATDNVTSNGAVTLSGTLTGPAGTAIVIDDGQTALGTAVLGKAGIWSFSTLLGAGSHALTAVATDPAGNSAVTAAAAPITVITAAPTITLTSETLSADGTSEIMTGTVSGAPGTTVVINDGTTVLGTARLNGVGGWTYTASMGPGSYALTAVATDVAGNTASIDPAFTIAAPAQLDTLVLNLSEDAYKGDANVVLSVDGKQVGGVRTVTALRKLGQSQDVVLSGNFGPGTHTVGVNFLNDAWGGSSDTDRNLYVNSITLDGKTITENVGQLWQGLVSYKIATPVTTMLSITASEDAYKGDAQFTISVDGQRIGGTQVITALHGAGQTQTFSVVGDFSPGAHTVAINFLNDMWAGTAATDRNLYIGSIAVGGKVTTVNGAQMSGGTAFYGVQAPAVSASVGAAATPFSIASGSTLILDKPLLTGSTATFAGPNATLQLSGTPAFQGSIAGFAATDTLDMRAIGFGSSTTSHYTAQGGVGALTLTDGTHATTLSLQGSYSASQFHLASDGQGGTAITLA